MTEYPTVTVIGTRFPKGAEVAEKFIDAEPGAYLLVPVGALVIERQECRMYADDHTDGFDEGACPECDGRGWRWPEWATDALVGSGHPTAGATSVLDALVEAQEARDG